MKKSNALAGFRPLRGSKIEGKRIRLREKKLSDVRNDYNWQRDPGLARFDAVPVLEMPFALYLLDYTTEIKKPRHNRFPLAIETVEGKHIGNCTCYEIDEKKGETQFGIMIGDAAYRDKGYGQDVVDTVVSHIFRNTSLNRVYLKTLDWNLRAQTCFSRCGFTPCGQLRRDGFSFILMELNRELWEKGRSGETGDGVH
ncbi:MAG: GNAT family protein [Dehalococcoidales bacterium]